MGELKKIRFSNTAGEIRTETVKPDGYEPFEITFEVPGVASDVRFKVDSANGDSGSAIMNYVNHALKSWSLGDLRLESLEDSEIVFAIFNVIHDAEKSVKN